MYKGTSSYWGPLVTLDDSSHLTLVLLARRTLCLCLLHRVKYHNCNGFYVSLSS